MHELRIMWAQEDKKGSGKKDQEDYKKEVVVCKRAGLIAGPLCFCLFDSAFSMNINFNDQNFGIFAIASLIFSIGYS